MDKQQEQMNQNPNQEVGYISGFLNEDEEVNESDFNEPIEESKKADESAGKQQNKLEGEEQPKKPKRTHKTIEQELAELDEKRQKLIEKKRRQEAHEKIIFGAIVIAMLKDMRKKDDINFTIICEKIREYVIKEKLKNNDIINNLISKI